MSSRGTRTDGGRLSMTSAPHDAIENPRRCVLSELDPDVIHHHRVALGHRSRYRLPAAMMPFSAGNRRRRTVTVPVASNASSVHSELKCCTNRSNCSVTIAGTVVNASSNSAAATSLQRLPHCPLSPDFTSRLI